MLRFALVLLLPLVLMACPPPASTQDPTGPPAPEPGPAPGTVQVILTGGGCVASGGARVCTVTPGDVLASTAGTPPLRRGEALQVRIPEDRFGAFDAPTQAALQNGGVVQATLRTEERMGGGLVWTLVEAVPLAPAILVPDPAPAPGTVLAVFESAGCSDRDGTMVCAVTVEQVEGYAAGTSPLEPGTTLSVHVPASRFEALEAGPRATLEAGGRVRLVLRTEEHMGEGTVWALVEAQPAD